MSKNQYEMRRGSDVLRDGMYLELSIRGSSPLRLVAEVFYSDITHEYFVTGYEENIPLEILENLISKAKKSLPPMKSEQRKVKKRR